MPEGFRFINKLGMNGHARPAENKTYVTYGGDRHVLMDVDFTSFSHGMMLWAQGARIQEALHFLNADQREFLMTGITPPEWDQMVADLEKEQTDEA